MSEKLYRALGLPPGVTAFVGGGGKTSLILALAAELSENHTVLIATSTHIYPPPCPVLISPTAGELAKAFEREPVLAAGSSVTKGKLGPLPELAELYPALANYALVEADGSRGLPLKAPAAHEPAIPGEARLVVAVMGLDGIGKPISAVCHRPELYALLLGKDVSDRVTPRDAAAVLMSERGGKKGVACGFAVVLNKADTEERLLYARETAALLPETVLITALNGRDKLIETWRNGRCL